MKTDGQKAADAELKKDPKRAHIRAQLLRTHSFLIVPFRKLKADELESEKVFYKLFPNIKSAKNSQINFMLKAIYEFQR